MSFAGKAVREDADRRLLALLVALVALTLFPALFILRALDGNRLTSWLWAFQPRDVPWVLAAMAAGMALAYAASGIAVPGRWRGPVLFLSAFATAAAFWSAPEVIVDAARYFMQAKYLEFYGPGFFLREWGGGIAAWTDLPLVPFLHGLLYALFGEARITVQVFTTSLFAGTAVLTWLIGRTLWDDAVGGVAGALLLAIPYLLTQPALALVDVPTMFFLTLALFTTIRAIDGGEAKFLAAAPVAILLAMLSKYSTWPLLSVTAVVVLAHLERDRAGVVLKRAAIVAVATILLAGAVAAYKFDVFAAQLELLWRYQWPGLSRWEESHASTFLFQVHPFVTLAAFASLAVAAVRRDRKYFVVAWMLALLLLLGVKRARYILIALPMLALMAGYALREIGDGRLRRFAVSCAIVSALVTALYGYLPLFKGMSAANLQAAGERLDAMGVDRAEVITLPQTRSIINPAIVVPLLDLYSATDIIYPQAPAAPPDPQAVAISPLRFTWEFDVPAYYRREAPADVVLLVTDGANEALPDGVAARIASLRLSDEFTISDGIFRFRTFVRVYRPMKKGVVGEQLRKIEFFK